MAIISTKVSEVFLNFNEWVWLKSKEDLRYMKSESFIYSDNKDINLGFFGEIKAFLIEDTHDNINYVTESYVLCPETPPKGKSWQREDVQKYNLFAAYSEAVGLFFRGQPQPEFRFARKERVALDAPYIAAQYITKGGVEVYTRVFEEIQIRNRVAVSAYKNGKFYVSKTEKILRDEKLSDRNFKSEFQNDGNYCCTDTAIKSITAQFWLRGYFVEGGDWVVADDTKPRGSIKGREHISVQRGYHAHVTVEAEIVLGNGTTLHKKGDISDIILNAPERLENASEMLEFIMPFSSGVLQAFGISGVVFKKEKINPNAAVGGIEEFFFKAESLQAINSDFLQKLAFQI